jgi:PAS domain S-box-containing protein
MSTHPIINTPAQAAHFQLLVEGVSDYAIYMLTKEGCVASWNKGAQRFKGYAEHEILGAHFSCFYTEEDKTAGEPRRALEIATQAGRYEREGWRVKKDGSKFWVNAVIEAIYDENGVHIGFAKIVRDITDKRETALALEQTRATLIQAQKMEAVGQMTGGIAHDFNNLLTVIMNSLDLLAQRLREPTDIKLLRSAQRAATQGATLTQQLLSFARRQPLQLDRYNVNAIISRFEAVLRQVCKEMIVLDIQLAHGLSDTMLDVQQFESALLNLAINARDAMLNGGALSIRTENMVLDKDQAIGRLSAGSYVKVSITDTGCGMPEEVARRAFEPFFTTKEVGKGSGLGLSQVYSFATQSGGEVIIQSQLETGITIELYLPALSDNEVNLLSESDSGIAVRQKPSAGKVLIVEDEPDVLEIAVEFFRGMNYEVITANNGLDAIDLLKRTRDIDVLFSDVVMPKGMNGIEVARFTRKLCPAVKVILASGYPFPVLNAEQAALEEFIFLSKPYRWSELIEKLQS